MSTKIQNSSAIIFGKLVGDPYEDGTLTCDQSAIPVFEQLSGLTYEKCNLDACKGAQMTGPEYRQNGMIADLCNGISTGTNSAYVAKGLLDEHTPYILENNEDNTAMIIVFHYHFLKELRRQLTGEITFSQFSPVEQDLYDNYIAYTNGEEYTVHLQDALDVLDFWLVEEIQNHTHPIVTRSYDSDHKWWKIEERIIEEI